MKQFLPPLLVAAVLNLGIFSSTGLAAESSTAMEGLLELLLKKKILSAKEKGSLVKNKAATVDLQEIIELLRAKGTISRGEAASLMQGGKKHAADIAAPVGKSAPAESGEQPQLVAGSAVQKESAAPLANAEPAGAKLPPSPQPPAEELKPVIEVLREQGVLGVDEAAQISERIGKKWSAADEDDKIAAPDLEIEYSRTTLPRESLQSDISNLQSWGLIAADEGERIRKRFMQKLALERVTTDIGEESRREIRSQVESRVPTLPEWTQRIKLNGDIRLRYQSDFYDGFNGLFVKPDSTTALLNSSEDRHRMRVRARVGVTAKVNDKVEAGFSLATGNTTDPVSTNQTLGDSLNKKSIVMDLAYLRWKPLKSVTVLGGRFVSPWLSTDLVWDQDVNFDGVVVSYKPQLTPRTSLFITAGAFPIQEIELSSKEKWLFGGQLGVQYTPSENMTLKLAAAIYDFEHTTGVANDPARPGANDWTAPQFQQKGNTLIDIDPSSVIKTAYASDFREFNVTGNLDLGYWNPVRVILSADYVNNIGFDKAAVKSRTASDVKKETEGYQLGVTVGHKDTLAFGKWKALLFYKYLEADAVIDSFTDSDFHMGGTNAKGWIAGLDFGVGKNVWLNSRWLTANEISGPPLGVDVFQFNVNARF